MGIANNHPVLKSPLKPTSQMKQKKTIAPWQKLPGRYTGQRERMKERERERERERV